LIETMLAKGDGLHYAFRIALRIPHVNGRIVLNRGKLYQRCNNNLTKLSREKTQSVRGHDLTGKNIMKKDEGAIAVKSKDLSPAKLRDGTVQSVSIAAKFMHILSGAEQALPLGEIAKRADTSRSTAHRYLQSLVKEGLAQQDVTSGHYDLGPMSLSIGVAALRRVEPVEIAGVHVKKLAMTHAISAGIAIWTERGPTIVRWHNSAHFAISTIGLGTILPIDNTACGLVCQAYLPARSIAQARENQPKHFRGDPPLASVLQQVFTEQWAELTSHLLSNVTGQAAPIFDAQGELACVVTSAADLGQMQSGNQLTALKDVAEIINMATGGLRARRTS
jgi:DNA-binding IclR family transcriptional regulator